MSDSERLDQAIEKLIADQSPRAELLDLDDEELHMVRMAQLLRGSSAPGVRPEFAERLHDRLFPRSRRVSRRTAFLSGIGAMAAGLLAGVGLGRSTSPATQTAEYHTPLIGRNANARWVQVALAADVRHGSVRPFTAGAVQGFLIKNKKGDLRAISRICTHMGCALNFSTREQTFVCPCHGAEFAMDGWMRANQNYPLQLPSLPKIEVRVNGPSIEVLTA